MRLGFGVVVCPFDVRGRRKAQHLFFYKDVVSILFPGERAFVESVFQARAKKKGRLLRDELADEARHSSLWADELERSHNVPMVWESTNGKPRVSQIAAEEGPGMESLDQHAGADTIAEGHVHKDARSSASHKFGRSLSDSEAGLFLQTGLDLLKRASMKFSWKETSHCGFRPMNLAGYAKANQIWCDFNQHAGSWTMSSTHGSSLAFPSGGLCDKVLTDRIRYLAAFSCQLG